MRLISAGAARAGVVVLVAAGLIWHVEDHTRQSVALLVTVASGGAG
jgi:hypothetical protein